MSVPNYIKCRACCLVCDFLDIYTDTERYKEVFGCTHPKGFNVEDPCHEVCDMFMPSRELDGKEIEE